MEILIALLVLLAAFTVLGYPLYAARPRAWSSPSSGLGDLLAQRDGIYATLRDLDQDYQLGKLDDADYKARRERQLARAAVVLKELDAWGERSSSASANDNVEQEIAAFRHVRSGENGHTSDRFCPNCGHAAGAGDRFCVKCGHALS